MSKMKDKMIDKINEKPRILNEKLIEEAADKRFNTSSMTDFKRKAIFREGVEWAENQMKDLAIEFAQYCNDMKIKGIVKDLDILFISFLKERDEKS